MISIFQQVTMNNTNVTKNFLEHLRSLSNEYLRLRAKDSAIIIADTVFLIALGFGIPGSVFALMTVSRMPFSPTTLYIGFLAVSDLIALGLSCLITFPIPHFREKHMFFTIAIFSGFIFRTFSHWILAFICVERFASIRFPLQKRRLYTTRAVFLNVGIAFLIILAIFTVYFIFWSVHPEKFCKFIAYVILFAHLMHVILPGASIIVLTILSACEVKKIAQNRKNLVSEHISRHSVAMETQLTRLMFVTVSCFMVFALPWAVIDIYIYFQELISLIKVKESFFLIYHSLEVLIFMNNGINFYVYCACARGFRKHFVRVICGKKFS